MGSPIPYQVTATDISEASFKKINSQNQPIVLKPRENTLAFLLRSKLQEAQNRSAMMTDNVEENDNTTMGGSSMVQDPAS